MTEAEEIVEEVEEKLDRWEKTGRDVEGMVNDIEWLSGIFENVKGDAAQAAEIWCAYVWAMGRKKGLEEDEAKMLCEWRAWAMLNFEDAADYAIEYKQKKGVWRIIKGWILDLMWLDGDFTNMIPIHIREEPWRELRRETRYMVSYPPELYSDLLRRLAALWGRHRGEFSSAPPAERYAIADRLARALIRDMAGRLASPPRSYGPFRPRSLVFNVQAAEVAADRTKEGDLAEFLAEIRRRLDVISRARG